MTEVPRKTVLHVITGLTTGGAERSLHNLLRAGVQDACDNVVVSLTGSGPFAHEIEELGVPVYAVNLKGVRGFFQGLKTIFSAIDRHRPSVLQGWMYHGNLFATLLWAVMGFRKKLLWNIRHSLYDLGLEKPSTRLVIRLGALVSRLPATIVYNSFVARSQHEARGYAAAGSMVIPNGIDLVQFQDDEKAAADLRRKVGIAPEARVVGHASRRHPMKAHGDYYRAALLILDERPETQFLMAGRNVAPDNEEFLALVPPNRRPNFTFLGDYSPMTPFMSAVDVFVVSSAWGEAFPNVLLEAMACGVPCVSTDVGDASIVLGGEGSLVPVADATAMANAVTAYLRLDTENFRAQCRRCVSHVSEKFELTSVIEKYVELYR